MQIPDSAALRARQKAEKGKERNYVIPFEIPSLLGLVDLWIWCILKNKVWT